MPFIASACRLQRKLECDKRHAPQSVHVGSKRLQLHHPSARRSIGGKGEQLCQEALALDSKSAADFRLDLCVATQATIYSSLRALWARNPQKVSKRVFLGSAKKSPKIPEKVEKYSKIQIWVFFDFFGCFRGLFCRPPKRLFSRLFWDFGPRGLGDFCKWSLGSQSLCVCVMLLIDLR